MDIIILKEEAEKITEPRRAAFGNIRHKLVDIVIIGLLITISMGEDFVDMETFGKKKHEWLKTFLELPNGIPDSDTFRRVFERINPNEMHKCLNNWLMSTQFDPIGKIINIDGKTICGSRNADHNAFHVVSAWVAENQITLGQLKTEEKSNEITAVPELLDMLDIEGSIITADAMSCQKTIVEKITAKKADYVINLKGNQRSLYKDAESFFEDFSEFVLKTETLEKGHGRIEKREYFLEPNIKWLPNRADWTNLNAIGMVRSTVEIKGKIRSEVRLYITSVTDVDIFANSVRSHWSIENHLHWRLDVIFGEDSARARKDNSPLNMNILRKTALTVVNRTKIHRTSMKKKMFMAALDTDFLEQLIFGVK